MNDLVRSSLVSKLRGSVILASLVIAGCGTSTSCEVPGLDEALLGSDKIGDVRADLINETEDASGCKATLVIDAPTSDAISSLSKSMMGESFGERIESLGKSGASIVGLNQWQMRETVTVSYVVDAKSQITEMNVPNEAMDKLTSAVARASLEKDNAKAKDLGYLRVSRYREHRQREKDAKKTIEVRTKDLARMQDEVGTIKKAFLEKQSVLKQAGPKLMHLTGDVFRLESDLRNTISVKGGGHLKASNLVFEDTKEELVFKGTLQNRTNQPITGVTVNALLWSEMTGEGKEINLPLILDKEIASYSKAEFSLALPKDDDYRRSYGKALIHGAVIYPIEVYGKGGESLKMKAVWSDPREDIIATQKAKTVANNQIVSLVEKMQKLESDIMTARSELSEAEQVLQDIEHERPDLPMHAKKS